MSRRLIINLASVAYGALLFRVLVFKNVIVRIPHLRFRFGESFGDANLVPFKTISRYAAGEQGWFIAGLNLFGNILPFVPIGLLVGAANRTLNWQGALALAVAVGCAIEGAQLILRVGVFDIDDVILNAAGVMAGYGLAAAGRSIASRARSGRETRA